MWITGFILHIIEEFKKDKLNFSMDKLRIGFKLCFDLLN